MKSPLTKTFDDSHIKIKYNWYVKFCGSCIALHASKL